MTLNNIASASNNNSNFHYEINLFDIDTKTLSCHCLGFNTLIFQSSKPPYNISSLQFTKRLQSSQILTFTNKSIKTIVSNELSFHFLTFDGVLFSWDSSGNTSQIQPKMNSFFRNIKVVEISQSRTSTVCYDSYMNVYCWGCISHLTGQPSHFSTVPISLSKNIFTFTSAISKIVCVTGEACYCGQIQLNESNQSITSENQLRINHIDYKGFYDVYGGKNLVAFYDSNKDRVIVYNENIGLIEIRIKNYYIIKTSSIKFIDNAFFINVINEQNAKFLIEICFNNMTTRYISEGLKQINNGIMRTYKNEIDSPFIWSPYYTHGLSFASLDHNNPSLSLLEEKLLNITFQIPKQHNSLRQEQIMIAPQNNKNVNKENTNNLNNDWGYQSDKSHSIAASKKINMFREKVFGEGEKNQSKNCDPSESIFDNNNLEKDFEKFKRKNRSNKSLISLYKQNNKSIGHNSSIYGSSSNTFKQTMNEKLRRELQEMKSSYMKNKSQSNCFLLVNNHHPSKSSDSNKINNLLESRIEKELNISSNTNHSKRVKDLSSNKPSNINIKQAFSVHPRYTNRNFKSKFEEFSEQVFKSHNQIKPACYNAKEIRSSNSLLSPSFYYYPKESSSLPQNRFPQTTKTHRTSTESCILRYLKEKKLSKDKKLI